MPRGRVTISGLMQLYRKLRTIRPDVVQTWMYHADLLGGVIARLAGVKVVSWGIRSSNLEPGKSSRSTIIIARLCAWLSGYVPRVIVSCSAQAADIHQSLGYAKKKFVVIPNGYNLDQLNPDPKGREALRQEWGVDTDTPLLGMVARFDPQKDHLNLINALHLLTDAGQNFACVLIGTGVDEENQSLKALLAQHRLQERVKLLGRRVDIPKVMNALDLHVLSSSFGEAFPNVVAEAMACGTPCVATDVGDAALIVGDTGWIVPASDPQSLGNAISGAISEMKDKDKWSSRKAICREHVVDNFSIEKMVDNFSSAWLEMRLMGDSK